MNRVTGPNSKWIFALIFCVLPFSSVFPQAPVALASIVGNINVTAINVATIISNASLAAGVGFLFASFFKFDKHKKNPQQVPIGQPLTLLIIAASLCTFPTLMPLVQSAIFGTTAQRGVIGTAGIVPIIGGDQ